LALFWYFFVSVVIKKTMESIASLFGAKPLNIIVPTILFVLLSPRFLLAVNDGGVPMIMPMAGAPLMSVLTHAAVFMVLYMVLRQMFAQYY
jgi:hypothetical protein